MGDVVILTNAFFAVGTGTASADRDLSGRLRSLKWSEDFDEHDVSVMGSTNRITAIGLGKSGADVEFLQSYTSADGLENMDSLLQTLRDLSATGRKFLIRMRPVNSSRGATNPEYSMLSVMSKRKVFDGKVGDPMMNTISFLSAGDVTRSTVTS